MPNENQGTVKNRIAVITGASRGLDRSTASRRGVDIIFTYRSNRTEAESAVCDIEAPSLANAWAMALATSRTTSLAGAVSRP